MQDSLIGQHIDGYTIRALLGSGGMAQVYRAYDPRLDREVALKVLSAAMQRQPAFAERFQKEARTLASFQHPGIVQIYTIGSLQGRSYLAQELLVGPTLDQELAAARAQGTYLASDRVIPLLEEVASALDYAHARGIIHRDLKPNNLMRNAQGRMVLMDFGIAKAIVGAEKLTQTGMVLGTPQYLAPEQAQGRDLTAATDIYALGVILFEILTGRVPFDDPSALVVALAHLREPPPALRTLRPDLPPAVEAVVLQALAKAPEARFASAGALATAFQAAWQAPVAAINTMSTTATPVPAAAHDAARARAGVHAQRTAINPALADQARQARATPLATPPPLLPPGAPPLPVHQAPARRTSRTGLIAAGLIAAGLALLVAAFLLLRPAGGDSASSTATTVTTPPATLMAVAPTASTIVPPATAIPALPPTELPVISPTDAPISVPTAIPPTDAPISVPTTAPPPSQAPFVLFRAVLADAAASGLVDAETAAGLNTILADLEASIAAGDTKDTKKNAKDLEKAIDTAERKDTLDAGVADDLRGILGDLDADD